MLVLELAMLYHYFYVDKHFKLKAKLTAFKSEICFLNSRI